MTYSSLLNVCAKAGDYLSLFGDILSKKWWKKKWVELGGDSFIGESLMNPKHEAKPLEIFEWYQIKHAAISDVSRRFWNFVGLGMGIDNCKCQKQRVFSEGVGPRKDLRSKRFSYYEFSFMTGVFRIITMSCLLHILLILFY